MSWFRVDDSLPQSIKLEALEEYPTHVYSASLAAWMLLGCDCSSPARRTDGYVSRTRLVRCLPKLGEALALEAAAALVSVGLWEVAEGGWRYHDWWKHVPPKHRPNDHRKHRTTVLTRDGFACVYCGRRLTEETVDLDHVVPRSRGGTDDPKNLAASCKRCNKSKGARTPQEWRRCG